jgi:hypothetical protein
LEVHVGLVMVVVERVMLMGVVIKQIVVIAGVMPDVD